MPANPCKQRRGCRSRRAKALTLNLEMMSEPKPLSHLRLVAFPSIPLMQPLSSSLLWIGSRSDLSSDDPTDLTSCDSLCLAPTLSDKTCSLTSTLVRASRCFRQCLQEDRGQLSNSISCQAGIGRFSQTLHDRDWTQSAPISSVNHRIAEREPPPKSKLRGVGKCAPSLA